MRVEMILARRKSRARSGGAAHAPHPHANTIDKSKSLTSPTNARGHAPGRKLAHSSSIYADPRKEKLAYEYLVKFKNASYLHTKWLTYFQIGKCNSKVVCTLGTWNEPKDARFK